MRNEYVVKIKSLAKNQLIPRFVPVHMNDIDKYIMNKNQIKIGKPHIKKKKR